MTQSKKKIHLSSAIERFLYAKVQKADWDKARHKSTFWFTSAEYWGKKAGIVSSREQLALSW